jgi:hypothetical protein
LRASIDAKNLEKVTEVSADESLDKVATPGEMPSAIRRTSVGE